MPKYRLYLQNIVSTTVKIEAESIDAAMDEVWKSDDCPGAITAGAFGRGDVDDSDWAVYSVNDAETGEELWRGKDPV